MTSGAKRAFPRNNERHAEPVANTSSSAAAPKGDAKTADGHGTVVVVGGSGGMTERYREVLAARGLEMRHFENRVPNGTRHILGKVAAVIVMVGMVSHSLRDQVKGLVTDDAPVVYLRSASVSALRTAVGSLK